MQSRFLLSIWSVLCPVKLAEVTQKRCKNRASNVLNTGLKPIFPVRCALHAAVEEQSWGNVDFFSSRLHWCLIVDWA